MSMAGNEDAIETTCRRYATNCGVAYLKARIQWPLFSFFNVLIFAFYGTAVYVPTAPP